MAVAGGVTVNVRVPFPFASSVSVEDEGVQGAVGVTVQVIVLNTTPSSAAPPANDVDTFTAWPGVPETLDCGVVTAGITNTVIATEAGLTVPVNVAVASVTVALSESVGLLAVA
jgi:hypothetical protein